MKSGGARQSLYVLFAPFWLVAAAVFSTSDAQGDPKVPHGLDPGGVAIALITDGIDYTDGEIAKRLARDGEGEPIALDLVDGDVRPYSAAESGRGTELAKLLLSTYKKSRLVIVRTNPEDAESLARAAVFVSRTPSRIAVIGSWGRQKDNWLGFAKAVSLVAEQNRQILFVVPGGDQASRDDGTNFPAQFKLANAISAAPFEAPNDQYVPSFEEESIDAWLVGPATAIFGAGVTSGPRDSVEAAVMLAGIAGCAMEGKKAEAIQDAASLKAAILEKARNIKSGGHSAKVHDPMCWYGGELIGPPQ